MSTVFEMLPDAKAALERIIELQSSGLVDIFRGQTKQWPILSSLARLNPQERRTALRQLHRFVGWASNAIDLPDLRGNSVKACAVAQHYGMPTRYIDLTTDPLIALFFATDGVTDFDSRGCVFCLSRKDIENQLSDLRRQLGANSPALLDIDVSNLWRLQAQRGLFIDWPFESNIPLDAAIPLRVITFTQSAQRRITFPRERIYPNRKSRLEIRLDQFFREEFVQDGLKKAQEHMEVHYARWDENCHAFLDCQLPEPHPSWDAATVAKWSFVRAERFDQIIAVSPLRIEFPQTFRETANLPRYFSSQLAKHLRSQQALRGQAVTFDLVQIGTERQISPTFNRALALFWDGVRQLPYSDTEICVGLGNLTAALFCSEMGDDYLERVFGETISAEFSAAMQVHFRAPVSRNILEECLRKDFRNNLDIGSYPNLKEPSHIIYHVHGVRRLFVFEQFQRLMVTAIIPGQLALQFDESGYYRGTFETTEPDWIVFNPLDITHMRSSTAWMARPGLRNRDRVIALHRDLSDDELKVVLLSVYKQIEGGKRPATVTFSGYEDDDREIFDIPGAADFGERLIKLGFASILEVTTMIKGMPEAYNPYAFGAFEVWLLATRKMRQQHSEDEAQFLFRKFIQLLPLYNELCDEICGQMKSSVLKRMEEIQIVGLLGRVQASKILERSEAPGLWGLH